MELTAKKTVIIIIAAGVIVFLATRKEGFFDFLKKKEDVKNPAKVPPALKAKNIDGNNAETAISAVKLAIADGANENDLKDLRDSIKSEYGLSISINGDNDIMARDNAGRLILKDSLVNG